jgi:hypothetical protein
LPIVDVFVAMTRPQRMACVAAVVIAAMLLVWSAIGGDRVSSSSSSEPPRTEEERDVPLRPTDSDGRQGGAAPVDAPVHEGPGQQGPEATAARTAWAVFGSSGWSEALISNLAKSAIIERDLRRAHVSDDTSASIKSVEGYFSASRRVLTDPANNFCRVLPSNHQPLRSSLNLNAQLCFSPASAVRPPPQLPAFRRKPHSKEIIGVEKYRPPEGPRVVGCQGVFVLTKDVKQKLSVCEATNKVQISKNKEWDAVLRAVFGPLHLRLYLEGPEIVVGDVQFDESRCEYFVHFHVKAPGSYNINFKVAHNDFWGVDETHHRTQHNYNKYLLPRSFPNVVCDWDDGKWTATVGSATAGSQSPKLSALLKEVRATKGAALVDARQWRWVQRPTPHTLFGGRIMKAATLQYLPIASSIIGVDPKYAPPFGIASVKGATGLPDDALLGAPRGDVVPPPQLTWLSESVLKTALRRLHRAVGSPARPLQLFISGDSQSRSVFWAIRNYFSTVERYGDGAAAALDEVQRAGGITKGQQDDDEEARRRISQRKHEDFDAKAGAAALSFEARDAKGEKIKFASTNFFDLEGGGSLVKAYYVWDSYLDELAANAAKADIVIAGFGSHPASWGQWTFAQFEQRVGKIARVLCEEAVVKRKPVLYYGCPAWPKMKLVDNFRATNQRLAAMNGIAAVAIERECRASLQRQGRPSNVDLGQPNFPVRFVDFFEMSTAMLKHSKDGSHYDGSVVVSTLAHEMLAAVLERIERSAPA